MSILGGILGQGASFGGLLSSQMPGSLSSPENAQVRKLEGGISDKFLGETKKDATMSLERSMKTKKLNSHITAADKVNY